MQINKEFKGSRGLLSAPNHRHLPVTTQQPHAWLFCYHLLRAAWGPSSVSGLGQEVPGAFFFFFFFFSIFWPCRPASGILVPFALEAQSLNHWTTMEVPAPGFLMTKIHFPPCERIRNRKKGGKHCLLRAVTPSSLGGSYRLPFRAPA